MDDCARRVLKTQKSLISQNLYLEDSILDDLEQEDILNETMVQKIKAERTNDDKITELLFILKKRGPRAFDAFVEAVRKHYDFLAEKLEQLYRDELDKEEAPKLAQETVHDDSVDATSNNITSPKVQYTTAQSLTRANSSSTPTKAKGATAPSVTNAAIQTVGIDTVLRCEHSDSSVRSSVRDGSFFMTQQQLNSLDTKLKSHMISSSIREHSFASPKPATLQTIDDLVNELLSNIDKCYRILRDVQKKYSLPDHIEKLLGKNRVLKERLNTSEETRNKYADNITKYQNKCRDKDQEIKNKSDEKDKMKAELDTLRENNTELVEMLNQQEMKIKDLQGEIEFTSEQLLKQRSEFESLQQEYNWCIGELNKNKPCRIRVMGRSPYGENPQKIYKPYGRKPGIGGNDSAEINHKHHMDMTPNHAKPTQSQNKANNKVKNNEQNLQATTETKNEVHPEVPSKKTFDNTETQSCQKVNSNIKKTDYKKVLSAYDRHLEPSCTQQANKDKAEKINGVIKKRNSYKNHDLQENTKKGTFRKSQMTPHLSSFSTNSNSMKNTNYMARDLETLQVTNSQTTDNSNVNRRSISPGRNISPRQKLAKPVSPTRTLETMQITNSPMTDSSNVNRRSLSPGRNISPRQKLAKPISPTRKSVE